MTPGCACTTPGVTYCSGGRGVDCCGGVWSEFHDGPCAPGVDAGAPTCEGPAPGCPCDTEGDVRCPTFEWRLVCSSGIWAWDVGVQCCS